MKKWTNGGETLHYWDGDNIVAEKLGTVTSVYARGLSLISCKSNTRKGYYVQNAHGDITKIVPSGDGITVDYEYDAYGNCEQEKDRYGNPFRYCGEYWDEETENIYLRARYYDSSTGRFISEDPIKDGLNWYVYCGNNPIGFVDPSGLKLTISIDDYQAFEKYSQSIYGSDNLTFEMDSNKKEYTLTKLNEADFGENGSQLGRNLLRFMVNSDEEFEFVFKDAVGNSNFTAGKVTIYTKQTNSDGSPVDLDNAEIESTMIHEFTHAFSYTQGYEGKMRMGLGFTNPNDPQNAGYSEAATRQYSEAMAITVEQKFRKEMGYPERNTVKYGGIGANDYGMWPLMSIDNPKSIYYGKLTMSRYDIHERMREGLFIANTINKLGN